MIVYKRGLMGSPVGQTFFDPVQSCRGWGWPKDLPFCPVSKASPGTGSLRRLIGCCLQPFLSVPWPPSLTLETALPGSCVSPMGVPPQDTATPALGLRHGHFCKGFAPGLGPPGQDRHTGSPWLFTSRQLELVL